MDLDQAHFDVVILGAGLAGLTLSRHLLLDTDKTILLLDRAEQVPARRQKVGESTVQLAGNYLSKVLDLEEHLLSEHCLKYNLRFYWKTPGEPNDGFEHYSQTYIRKVSNVASYQLDRNKLEAELLRLNRLSDRFHFQGGAKKAGVDLQPEGSHSVRFEWEGRPITVQAGWVVDATGGARLLSRKLEMQRPSRIPNCAAWAWVDGLVDIEKLTDRSRKQVRLDPDRAATGHFPFWLATNHFLGEGFWFWVIPLQGKTSLGVVFDPETFPAERVATAEKFIEWACEEFPLFARDLPNRRVFDRTGLRGYAHDCVQTLNPQRWAMTGIAGRFTDPLYSPGSDLISLHNTLIVDAILTEDPAELAAKCRTYEQVMKAFYGAYVPSYADSYNALGDPETMVIKYTWELTVYFGFYVFPFINDLYTNRRFLPTFLNRFSRLGPVNRGMQELVRDYYRWKKAEGRLQKHRVLHDFSDAGPLAFAEKAFYRIGEPVEQARRTLEEQLANLEELARFLLAHVAARVLDEPRVLTHRAFVEGLDIQEIRFEPEVWRQCWQSLEGQASETYAWSFAPCVLDPFWDRGEEAVEAVDMGRKRAAMTLEKAEARRQARRAPARRTAMPAPAPDEVTEAETEVAAS